MNQNIKANNSTRYMHLQSGLTLIELMVAVVIGLILIAGAANLYVKSRNTYDVNDSVARMQETARYAMNAIESDLRRANLQGFNAVQTSGSANIGGANPDVDANQTKPSYSAPTVNAVASSAAVNACGVNFAVDFTHYVQGDNNGLLPNDQGGGAGFLSATRNSVTCAVFNGATKRIRSADTLTIRGTSESCGANTLHLTTNYGYGSQLTNGGTCTPTSTTQKINDVLVHAYYMDQDSTGQTGVPSLRRMILGSGPGFSDEEVIPGVEDLQVQFGIETAPAGSSINFTGIATQYVDPNSPILNDDHVRVVTVRVWLLVRGDAPESGFTDLTSYEYADRAIANGETYNLAPSASGGLAYKPSLSPSTALNDPQHYRRLLISKTFQIRNTQVTTGVNQ